MKKIVFILLFFTSFVYSQEEKSEVLSQKEFKAKISEKEVQLIDVRTVEEYSNGHINNAKNINYNSEDFKKEISKLDKSKAVFVYCQAGGRSASATKVLVQMGFSKVYDLKGGFSVWKD